MGTRVMKCLTNLTVKGLVNAANVEGIRREDVINIVSTPNQYILIYYGEK